MTALLTRLPNIADAQLPATYEAAQQALAECANIDECQDWADKAAALASYGRQANNDALHKLATRIQARAIRRCGEILEEIRPAKNQYDARVADRPSSRKAAAEEAGLSDHQRKTALRVASIPKDEFEAYVEAEEPATVTELAERGTKKNLIDLEGRHPEEFALATYALGHLQRLAEFSETAEPAAVVRGMSIREIVSLYEPIEIIEGWLAALSQEVKKML